MLSLIVSGGTESAFDLHRNGSLLNPANIGTTLMNYSAGVVLGQSYPYYIVVRLSNGTTVTSNTVNKVTAPTTCQQGTALIGIMETDLEKYLRVAPQA
jgi:hypothetical protein